MGIVIMARSLQSTTLTISAATTVQNTFGANTEYISKAVISQDRINQPTSGIEVNEADRVFYKNDGSISSGASEVIDLYDFVGTDGGTGDGRDPVGQTLALAEIVYIAVANTNARTASGTLEVEPDSTNGWSPMGTHTAATGGGITGGGAIAKMAVADPGFVVTDASNHRIKLTANGADCGYSIIVVGRHDADDSSSSNSSSSSSSASSSSRSSTTGSTSSSSSVSSTSSSSLELDSSSSQSTTSASTSSTSSASSQSSSSYSSTTSGP